MFSSIKTHCSRITAVTLLTLSMSGWAADIDIYGPRGGGAGASNVLFFLDNSANWSRQAQAWYPGSVWQKCVVKYGSPTAPDALLCRDAIEYVFYKDQPSSRLRPWQPGFREWSSSDAPTQGQVEVRAIAYVVTKLICDAKPEERINVNVGLSMFSSEGGSVLNNSHATAFIYHAVQPLTGSLTSGVCKTLLDKLNYLDSNIQNSLTKAPASVNYSTVLYEVFKYFGGYTNPDLVKAGRNQAGSPVSGSGYGTRRFSANPFTLDDPAAFTGSDRLNYRSPLAASNVCGGGNYLILIGNGYPNSEPSNAPPLVFSGINYAAPTLSPATSDTARFADEWAYFLANTDVFGDSGGGVQNVSTYAVNVFNANRDAAQTKLLKSIAKVGGIGDSAYVEVDGDLDSLVKNVGNALVNIAAVNSIFTATTLPVSTTTQGAYLNQVFVGMFRPDTNFKPRWQGNLKQYKLDFNSETKTLRLVGQDGQDVTAGSNFAATAKSFWTSESVFFTELPSGTPASASDLPDGAVVEKGGVAQRLRTDHLMGASDRKVYTLPPTPVGPMLLSSNEFRSGNTGVTTWASNNGIASPTNFINWVRGENNVTEGAGMELFNGSYKTATSAVLSLGITGARHSIHGDVLHSRPLALNYGKDSTNVDRVVVYYGSNDGFFRAIDGRPNGGGGELWSLIDPGHYPLLKRLYSGEKKIHLPETDQNGAAIPAPTGSEPKAYGMDGPIGLYARYSSNGTSVTEAIIYPTMRRGGRTVHAINVKDPLNPEFLWKISGGTAGDPYEKLGQTWSQPKAVALPGSGNTPPILLVMGGGYDPSEDTETSSNIGNAIFIINGRTGAKVAELATDFSVPSDVTLVDVNFDGVVDRAYAADVRGNLYRIDFPTPAAGQTLLSSAAWTNVRAVKIASLGGTFSASGVVRNYGKVFFAPDAVVTKDNVVVMLGTGDREKPLLNLTQERFYLIFDTLGAPRAPALVPEDLTRVARIDNATMNWIDTTTDVNDPEGCYVDLATNGEKVINAPFTISGATYFGTNRPSPANSNSCTGDLGEAYAYKLPLFCKVPTKPQSIAGGGLSPSPTGGVVLIDGPDGKPIKVPFLIGGGEGGSAFKPSLPQPVISPIRSRLYWRIDNRNR